MVRRTVSLPESVEQRVRNAIEDEESFSAAVARLLEAGLSATQGRHRPAWVGSGDGPDDLGRRAEQYLKRAVSSE
jgi:hypothetical protein